MRDQPFDKTDLCTEMERDRRGLNRSAFAIWCGSILSAAAFVAGTVCAVIAWVTGDPPIHTAGTILLVSVIPCLLLVGFYLDHLDQVLRRGGRARANTGAHERSERLIPFRVVTNRGLRSH